MSTKLALITILEGRPDQSLPTPPVKPGQGLPTPPPSGGGVPSQPIYLPPTTWPPTDHHPDQELPTPPPGFPVHLPVFPPEVDNTLPGPSGKPDQTLPKPGGRPDNTLPSTDAKFELKYSPVYGWVLVPAKDDKPQPKGR